MTNQQRNYIDEQYRILNQYVEDVSHQRFPVNKDIRLAVERYKRDLNNPDYEFRKDKLDKFFYFLFYIQILQGNKYGRVTFEGWQIFYFANIYGWYLTFTDDRRYTTSFLTLSRKNGKTLMAVVQALYHLLYDGNVDAECYIVSQTNKLASTGLRIAKNICKHSPALKERVRNLQYSIQYRTDKTDNKLVATTGDPESLNSIKPSFGIIDESHLLMDGDLVDMLKSGMIGTHNPLMSIISTRGFGTTGFFQYEYEQFLKQVLRQEKTDDRTFICMFGLDDITEVADPKMWVKANPNLVNPKILTLAQLQDIYEQKRYRPSGLRNFVVLNLNCWYETTENTFIEKEKLDKVFVQEIDESLIIGEECFMGVDLSSSKDITSISLVFPPSPNHEKFIIKNFNFKSNSVNGRVKTGGIDLTKWIDSGEIIQMESELVDYEILFKKVEELSNLYDIQNVGYDSYNYVWLLPKIQNDLGLNISPVKQTAAGQNQPLKYMEKIIYEGDVVIDNDCSKWQFLNVVIMQDSNGNIKTLKDKAKSSIDSVVAITNAFALYLESLGIATFTYSGSSQ